MTDKRIIARRVTLEEFLTYMGGLEYISGRIVTGPGIELFVGVKEFTESIRALEEERKRLLKDDGEMRDEQKARKRDKRVLATLSRKSVSIGEHADRSVPVAKDAWSSAEGATDEELVLIAAGKMRLPKEPAVLEKLLKARPRHSKNRDVTRALLDERERSR